MRAWGAGVIYGLAMFAAGFVFGVLRLHLLVPHLGRAEAVLVEIPLMLAAAWIFSAGIAALWELGREARGRIAMGAAGLAVLVACEALFSIFILRHSPEAFLRGFATLAGALGLAGQVLSATFPLVQARGTHA